MFGKVFASIAIVGLLTGVLATGVLAAPAENSTGSAKHRGEQKDIFRGTVTAVNDDQLTVRNRSGEKTFLRTEDTQVFKGRHERATWSQIRTGDHVAVKFEERDGKLLARRVHLGLAGVRGRVESVSGNVITLRGKDGKDIRVTVNGDTKYFERQGKRERKPGSLSEIKAGNHLAAYGTRDANGSLDARIVVYSDKGTR